MARKWAGLYGLNQDGNKLDMTYEAVGTVVAPIEIAIYAGDNISLSRQAELVNGWQWLYQGIKERNLLDGAPWQGAVLYTGSNINFLTANDRRTESDLATLTEDDVIVALGPNVTATGDTTSLQAAITQLIEFALEETLKAA